MAIRWRPAHERSYGYLLGLYLGDGCVTVTAQRGVMLRICLGTEYRGIIDDCRTALVLFMPECRPRLCPLAGIQAVHVQVSYPEEFVRGLIHSDGCRTINRFRTKLPSGRVAEYAYARYLFSNLSDDIRGLFCAACDALDVRWTLSNPRNVSVAHRAAVVRLDAIGCGKD